MKKIDWPAVRAGAALSIAICLPIAVLARVVVDTADDNPSALAVVFYVAVLGGFAVGGWIAAKRSADFPYSSGGIAAMAAFATIQIVSVISLVVRDEEIKPVLIVANALFAYGAGLLGAGIEARRR